jgi:polyisoprenoid-binding protein YceI
MNIPEPTTDSSPTPPRQSRWVKRLVFGAIAAVVLFFGAVLLYAKVINDSPDELGVSDLDAALSIDAESTSAVAVSTDPPAVTDPPAATDPPAVTDPTAVTESAVDSVVPESAPAVPGSSWVVTDDSQLGYRIKEILFGVDTEAVGRTNQITGTMTLDGTALAAAEFTVDVTTISSDESRRDGQFHGRIMSTDEFPTATFLLTEPLELGVESAEGATVTAAATGDLTLRGVTNSVTFELTAKQENGKIGVLGNIPVVFADYEIANPSTGGITTEDNGLLEFVLVFEPA